jgi:hypothetical protein
MWTKINSVEDLPDAVDQDYLYGNSPQVIIWSTKLKHRSAFYCYGNTRAWCDVESLGPYLDDFQSTITHWAPHPTFDKSDGWIKCSDQMPEPNTNVFVNYPRIGDRTVISYHLDNVWQDDDYHCDLPDYCQAEYWKPLPEPPLD